MYLNDTFGDPNAPDRKGFPWGIDVKLPGIDVQSIALHENGPHLRSGTSGRRRARSWDRFTEDCFRRRYRPTWQA